MLNRRLSCNWKTLLSLDITRHLCGSPIVFPCSKLPRGFWNSTKNQQIFIKHLESLHEQKPGNFWDSMTSRRFKSLGGEGFIKKFGSFSELKKYFSNSSQSMTIYDGDQWNSIEKQRTLISNFKRELGIQTDDDWFSVGKKEFCDIGVGPILIRYESIYHMISSIFNIGIPLQFRKTVPSSYWKDIRHQRLFMDKIAKKLEIQEQKDWYRAKTQQIESLGGKRVLTRYDSLYEALKNIYPEHKWNIFDFQQVPRKFWQKKSNHKLFLDYLRDYYNVSSTIDWGNVTHDMVLERGGRSLFTKYSSFWKALEENYPNSAFDVYYKRKLPNNHWKHKSNIEDFLAKLEDKYSIKQPKDWYRISRQQINDAGGMHLIQQYGGLGNVLREYKPETKWKLENFNNRDKRSAQRELYNTVSTLFPHHEVIEDYFHEDLSRISGATVQFDVFIPQKQIAFEYHGAHHYNELPSFGSLELYQSRDKEKEDLCNANHIQLIQVPFYWANFHCSLSNFVKEHIEQLKK